jgi:uncharacterized protein YecE (DUF72 family)
MRKFFKKIDRGEMNFAWEPRGATWDDKVIKKICMDLDLWHCVDPFEKRTVTPENCYYRLHGRTGWRYKYEEVELEELRYLLPENRLGYVFFNNIYMTEDAVAFEKILNSEND